MSSFLLSDTLSLLSPGRKALLLPVILALLIAPAARAEEKFPVYPCIQANVSFWEDVYSRYTTTQGILHDQDNLAIVYKVVDLVDWNTSGAAAINKELIKIARQYYKNILTDLAEGREPATSEEKRVASFFPSAGSHAYSKARDNIRLQIGQQDRFIEGFIRSGAYMPYIQRVMIAYDLPLELAYLPHVESSFNPVAYSKAGAAGMWQFTRGTGRQYMMIDDIVDERYDPFFSSRAAARLLKKNYDQLGSWPLALTAYNYGLSGTLRAVKEKGTYENIFENHTTGIFKFASRNFYSEFVAAMNVARRLEKHTGPIADRPEATLSVRLPGYASAEAVRSHFQVPKEDFARLNPALRKPVLSGSKYIPRDFPVRIPATALTRKLQNTLPAGIFHASQIRDREYIVKQGDTAGSIARRYAVSLPELVQANNLNGRATIRVGQRLTIPGNPMVAQNINIIELEDQVKIRPN